MADRAITDDLLKTAIGLRVGAGVSQSRIGRLIDRFSSEQTAAPLTGEGQLNAEARNVPQNRREELLKALAELPLDPDRSDANTRRTMTASDVWPLRIAEDANAHCTAPLGLATNLDDVSSTLARSKDAESDEVHAEQQAVETADRPTVSEPEAPLCDPATVEEEGRDAADERQSLPKPVDDIMASTMTPSATVVTADHARGGNSMWNQHELENVKKELELRHDEMLGRHAKPNFRSLDLKMADYQRLAGHFQI
jgi:hypothetical protein